MNPPVLDDLFIIQIFIHMLPHAVLCAKQRIGIADHVRMEKCLMRLMVMPHIISHSDGTLCICTASAQYLPLTPSQSVYLTVHVTDSHALKRLQGTMQAATDGI